MGIDVLYPVRDEKSSKKFPETRWESLQSVFEEHAEKERELAFKHPLIPIICNWMIVAAVIMLGISFVIWGVNIHIQSKADAMTSEALAAKEQERQAEEFAKLQEQAALEASAEKIIENEAIDCAKALYGIRLFVDKYHYSEIDLKTYLRSAFNRADAKNISLHDVLFDGQYLASDEKNTVLDEYKQIALKAVKEWHEETSKPCDTSYQFAELNDNGIYLVPTPNPDGYTRRWRATA